MIETQCGINKENTYYNNDSNSGHEIKIESFENIHINLQNIL